MRRFICIPSLLSTLLLLALTVVTQSAEAQTYTVIHNFTGGADGASPFAGLTVDAAGNLYGTTSGGGSTRDQCGGCGTVFKLTRKGSSWLLSRLYSFSAGNDGYSPMGSVALGSDGMLYGTTFLGGGSGCLDGCGMVFQLTPSPTAPTTALASWKEAVLYRFSGGSDGENPAGDLTFDQSGNIYGAAGGWMSDYVIYKLAPSGGGWTETVLDSFNSSPTYGGLVFDSSGNLYGVVSGGDLYNYGAVFELSPSGSGWTEQILYAFTGESDGGWPYGGLIFDPSGNLYGTTTSGGAGGGGTVFQLMPITGGGWSLNTLYSFTGSHGPAANLTMDSGGNLYGTTVSDGAYQWGSVFKLAPSNGGWTYTSLHDFTGGSDGCNPWGSSVLIDAHGNLYGTAFSCGAYGNGVVFEITP